MQPSTPVSSTTSTKYDACSRLPCSRPCMSVNAMTTVSTAPSAMSFFRLSRSSSRGLRAGRLMSVLSSGQQAAEECGGVVAMALHHPAGLGGLAREDGVQDRAVLPGRVLDVHLEHRDRAQHV